MPLQLIHFPLLSMFFSYGFSPIQVMFADPKLTSVLTMPEARSAEGEMEAVVPPICGDVAAGRRSTRQQEQRRISTENMKNGAMEKYEKCDWVKN